MYNAVLFSFEKCDHSSQLGLSCSCDSWQALVKSCKWHFYREFLLINLKAEPLSVTFVIMGGFPYQHENKKTSVQVMIKVGDRMCTCVLLCFTLCQWRVKCKIHINRPVKNTQGLRLLHCRMILLLLILHFALNIATIVSYIRMSFSCIGAFSVFYWCWSYHN